MKKIMIAYIPVLHAGYMKLFQKHHDTQTLYIVGNDLLKSLDGFDYLVRKDRLRALEPEDIKSSIEALNLFSHVEILGKTTISNLQKEKISLVMPNEDITRTIAETYFCGHSVVFDSIFLRWHRDNTAEQQAVKAHQSVSFAEFEETLMSLANEEASKSFDWWRQVGAVIVPLNGRTLIAHNVHLPEEQTPYIEGDPRSVFKRGIHLELSTAEHAEAILIAEAARYGEKLEGAHLYVTDFPCPPCAKLIARSGITHCYFSKGYAVLDGEKVMKNKGVELIYIEQETEPLSI